MPLRTQGFILPSTILLSLAIAIITATFMQYIANSSQALNKQTYTSLAQEAADAGISYAITCVKQAVNPSTWSPLTPDSDCFGKPQSGLSTNVMAAADRQWQSTFSVAPATVISTTPQEQQVTAVGTVKFFANGFQVGTVTVSRAVTLASSQDAVAVSTGNSLTALASDTHSCAIANGQLYCWGDNASGQLGQGDTTDRSVPTPVQIGAGQVFNNKMVTKVTVGTGNTCAIADGQLYCWGDNASGQLGQGDTTSRSVPTLVQAGPGQVFYNKTITNIALSKSTYANKAACAITNGITYCWGSNATQQLGQSTASTANITPSYTPIRVYGYNSGDNSSVLYGKKAQSVTIGSNDACSSVAGTVYCWGNTSGAATKPPAAVSVSASNTIEPLSLKNIGSTTSCAIAVAQMYCRANGGSLGNKYGNDPKDALSAAVDAFDGAENTTSPTGAPYSGKASDNGGEDYCVWDATYGVRCLGSGNNLTENPMSVSNVSTTALRTATSIGVGGMTGSRYGCAILNGGLACWGTETQGQLADNTPSGTSKTQSTGVFSTTTPGFGSDNVVYNGGYYKFKVAATGQIAAGTSHECALALMKVVCWGSNSNGQLGTGNTSNQTQPTIIKIDVVTVCSGTWLPWWLGGGCAGQTADVESPVEQIAAGGNHSCAVTDRLHNEPYLFGVGDATPPASIVYCWGSNSYGELGNNTNADSSTPVHVKRSNGSDWTSDNRITAISAGARNTCMIDNFQLYCWGDNTYGQLGNGSTTPSKTPVLVTGALAGMQVTAVSVGATHICAIANGNGYCWGDNTSGQLGLNSTNPAQNPSPQLIQQGVANVTDGGLTTATFTAISAGNGFTCAIINGTVACWGKNDQGQTGTGNVVSPLLAPTAITGAAGSMQADSISAGDSHACAVLQARVYCWGNNANGRIGNGLTTSVTTTPTLVSSGGFSANTPLGATLNASINVASGGGTSCSVTNANIICWGAGTSGQIGTAGTNDVSTPATIPLYRSPGSSTIGPIY